MGKSPAQTVQETFRYLSKQYDTVNVKQLSELPYMEGSIVSTGIIGLDIALGTGGIKKGSIVEIFAPESAGKTTLALQLCKQYESLGKPVLYIDSERTLTRETIESRGISGGSFYLMHVDSLEMALEVCRVCAGAFGIIVIDSLAGLLPNEAIQGDVGDYHVGLFSKIMSRTLPMLVPVLEENGCTMVVTTQLREKVGVMFGNPEYATGGRALKYYASVRMEIRRGEMIKNDGAAAGCRVKAKIVKNKIAAPYTSVEFDIMFSHGVSVEGDILDHAVENRVVAKNGAWYSYNGERIGQGRENAKKYLKEHPAETEEIAEKLREMCFGG